MSAAWVRWAMAAGLVRLLFWGAVIFLAFVAVGWILGFVHITGIQHGTTIEPRIPPSRMA